ncbi:MAG: hypothetical protein FJ137_03535 [Deltaproteobacteria bacterium]|nr:hypothetical protein [Deltaproteobacteria bacterium]
MRRVALISLLTASFAGAGCFDVKPPPDPPPVPAGSISGRILVGDADGDAAQDPAAVAALRRELAAALNDVASPSSSGGGAPPLDVRGRGPKDRPRPAAVAGEAAVFFDRGRFDATTLATTLVAMLQQADLAKVKVDVAACAGRMFCRVRLLGDDGFLDESTTDDVVDRLNGVKAPGVRVVARNVIHHGFRVPNDPLFGLQWHYQQARLPPAWDLTIGNANLVVAVVASGIRHGNPDLGDSIARDPENFNQFVEMDFVSVEFSGDGDGLDLDAEDPGDDLRGPGQGSFHGTHTAGTVGAETDNNVGIAGVLWDVQIVPVRVLGMGLQGSLTDILTGLLWAVGDPDTGAPRNKRPAKVVNMSLGADTDPTSQQGWEQIINAILDNNQNLYPQRPILVVAAGNDGKDAGLVTPANIDRLITVGATRLDGVRADYSNFGAKIDVMAPGGQVQQDLNSDNQPDGVLSTLGNNVEFEQGTSMAAPHVTGIAGLVVSAKPELTHDQVHQLLRDTADRRFQCNEGCGNGIIDAVQALLVSGVQVEPTPRLTVDTQTVVFETGIARRDIRVLNLGSAAGGFTVSLDGAQAAHFSVTPTTGTAPPTGNVELVVRLDRGTLRAGSANLIIDGTGDAANQRVLAVLSWNDAQPALLAELERVQVATFRRGADGALEPMGTTEAARADGFAYTLTGLPAGDYEVRAVGDNNADGVFDAQFESVGAWPVSDGPRPVALEQDATVTGIDFAIAPRFVVTVDNGVGAPCAASTSDGDCAGIDFAPDPACIDAFPGGYCSRLCDDGECGPFARCDTLTCGNGEPCNVCLQRCVDSAQCRSGYVCVLQTCVPPGFDG